MANSWLSVALVSPLNPAAPAGSFHRPPPFPDPPDPPDPSQFPPLGTIPPSRKSPFKPSPPSVSQSPTKPTVVQVVSSAVNSHPASNSASAASLLSSYFNPPLNLSNFNSRSVNSSTATVKFTEPYYNSGVSAPSPHGLLGSAPPPLQPLPPALNSSKPSPNLSNSPPPPPTTQTLPSTAPVLPTGSIQPNKTWVNKGHLMKNCPKKSQEWTLVKDKSRSSPKKTSNDFSDTALQHPSTAISILLPPTSTVSDPTTSQQQPPTSPDPPIASPQPSSMIVDNPPLPSLLEEKTLNICDSEMDDAPGPLPPDLILALPAPHISRPIIPSLPSSTPKLVTHVTSTSFNPFIPQSTPTLSPTSPNHRPKQSSPPSFSVVPTSNPFLPLSFEASSTPSTSGPSSPPSAQGKDDPHL
ncbi:hypothetical protein IGI04_024477 [Brassica rapa subsp. trilocularis]|uniref:Uncharacterized protein n=1 Tax=Brassica rapa subsp. trilocularis TaxID=1813537 RepID=A0ABQ7MA99_BRACM|nr:hypothetical protein IGI04_024477 [Brassica rapa subsp. trilocularis]